MSTPINETFARLTMLEFAVEVMIANELSRQPQAASVQFKNDFISRFSSPIFSSGPILSDDEQAEAWIAERTQQMASRLMEKVASRESEIRGTIISRDQNQ
jgi:hypothetical protein